MKHEKENQSKIFPEIRIEVVELIMQIMEDNPYAVFKSLQHVDVGQITRILIKGCTTYLPPMRSLLYGLMVYHAMKVIVHI